jgi:hypothetical protein
MGVAYKRDSDYFHGGEFCKGQRNDDGGDDSNVAKGKMAGKSGPKEKNGKEEVKEGHPLPFNIYINSMIYLGQAQRQENHSYKLGEDAETAPGEGGNVKAVKAVGGDLGG